VKELHQTYPQETHIQGAQGYMTHFIVSKCWDRDQHGQVLSDQEHGTLKGVQKLTRMEYG
jgi:hypothetical protein